MGQAHDAPRPIQRSLLTGSLALLVVLVLSISAITYCTFSSSMYARYDAKLDDIISFVEHNADADDLARCIATKTHSRKYDNLQSLLNTMVDDFELEYLYIVIPSQSIMTNVVSATSAAERAAGESELPLLETTDAYSAEELARFLSYWDEDEVSYFEESSDYGTFYTACKPLKDSTGNVVALVCADLSVEALQKSLNAFFGGSVLVSLVIFGLFWSAMAWWIRRTITTPLRALEQSAQEFASKSHEPQDPSQLVFHAPNPPAHNEIASLTRAITKMADDMRTYVTQTLDAQQRASEIARDNARIAEQAKSAQKIAELSESVTALFENMPCLSFSKDAGTGKYLACNKAFAEYANKQTPAEVVGLTDHQIFDDVTARHFVEDDAKTLRESKPFVFFEDVLDGGGNPRQFQTTKMKFYDTSGRLCLLGMSIDVTDLMIARRETLDARRNYETLRDESVTYHVIARALSADYQSLYYVDLDSGHYTVYDQHTSYDSLAVQEEGDDFFATALRTVQSQVYEADRKKVVKALNAQEIRRSIDEMGHFTLSFRVIVNGEPTYMGLKATRVDKDDGHLVIGISNIDAQMRQQEAARRIQEEQATIARITALSGDYLVIYAVNPDTNEYVTYQLSAKHSDSVSLTEGKDFFRDVLALCDVAAHPDDLGIIHTLLLKERIVSEIRTQGIFTMNYRQLVNGTYAYLNLRAALVEEADGPQLIIGLSNVDAQVKRDREFAMVQNMASRDALTGVKNKHAYVDAEKALNERIASGEPLDFAIVVCDLNNLKFANDTHGHQAGDKLLKQACSIICNVFKHSPVYRIGGDEFVAVLQGHDHAQAPELLELLAASNERNKGTDDAVIAWGISHYQDGDNVAAVFSRADAAMYDNKRRLKEVEDA